MNYAAAKYFIVKKLNEELDKNLYYHGFHHTIDVLNAAIMIAEFEDIRGDDLTLLKTGALFHDCGFLKTYKNHEEAGCEIARENLPQFDYNPEQIEAVCGLIMATKIPQTPKNFLEQVICDADLDYLGREDFELIAATLFRELKENNLIDNEQDWNRLQVKFLNNHKYFTFLAKRIRENSKQRHLAEIQKIVDTY
ncbi:MAG: hypothetical protein POELPBGB_03364 [Bacteroidia bacterium]|nr:hypothetical protein [Bacteroidia bacterium]